MESASQAARAHVGTEPASLPPGSASVRSQPDWETQAQRRETARDVIGAWQRRTTWMAMASKP
jgi:hypothetical protein